MKRKNLFFASAMMLLIAGCGQQTPEKEATKTSASTVPDLGSEKFWQRTTDGSIVVTPDNFIRAESDLYLAGQVADGAFGKFKHTRDVAPVDNQLVIRLNRDTIYSAAVFDLDAGPVTVTLPDSQGRFMSMLVINQDHYNPLVGYEAGDYVLSRELVGTRYGMVAIRTLANPNNEADMKAARALQDAIAVSQPGGPGKFDIPSWDQASQAKVRAALLQLAGSLPDMRYSAGAGPEDVDAVRRLIASAAGWGLNPDKDAIYLNVNPEQNDGKSVYQLTVKEVPVEAFWSISVYNREGYYEPNDENAYTVNSVTGVKNDSGEMVIQFGDCGDAVPNCLPVVEGWNYMVRLYRPDDSILKGEWQFPEAVLVSEGQ